MSASQDKRVRSDGSEPRMNDRQKEQLEKKNLRKKAYIVAAVFVVLVVFVLVFNSNLFYTHTAAVSINDTDYTVADFNYYYVGMYNNYYSNVYNTYGSYASLLMPSTSSSLRDQLYDTDQTWAQMFQEEALAYMDKVTMLCDEAETEGFTLTDDDYAQIDGTVTSMLLKATSGNYHNLDSYLTYIYGKGMTEEIFHANLEKETLAQNYSTHIGESFEYTNDELSSYYAEHKDEYDYINYRMYFVKANVVADDETTTEDETVDFDTAMAEAASTAEDFVASATDETAFAEYAKTLDEGDDTYNMDSTIYTTQGQSLSSTYSEWLLDSSRKMGDVCCISTGTEEATTNGYYVLYFLGRDTNDYYSVSGYYMLVTPETVTESDYEDEAAYQEAVDAANGTAEQTIDLMRSAYEATEGGYDNFAETATNNYSNLTDYQDFTKVGKNDFSAVVTNWLFDSARKEGDTAVLFDETNGYFYVYYSGQADKTYDLEIADSSLRSEDYTAWQDEQLANYTTATKWVMIFSKKMASLGA